MTATLQQSISKIPMWAANAALALVVLLGFGLAVAPSAQAQTFTTLYNFAGYPDGANSYAGLIMDSKGNLYGTTSSGGEWNQGTVFEMVKTDTGYTEEMLYSFTGQDDGNAPFAGLLLAAGKLYGTTNSSGVYGGSGAGTVFELTPGPNYNWTETTLYHFTGGNDGGYPQTGLIADKEGNLYGTTRSGGAGDSGVVFELIKGATGKKTTYTETVLYSFNVAGDDIDGTQPVAGLIFDKEGNLYGTTLYGGGNDPAGNSNAGTVFELSNNAGTWSETLLYSFCQTGGLSCTDGNAPAAGLTMDSKGNLYGTTEHGGASGNYGAVFELNKTGTGYTEEVLYSFCVAGYPSCTDGSSPEAGLIMKGDALYGTTVYGGDMNCINLQGWNGCGTVFELSWKTVKKQPVYTEKVLYAFQETTLETGEPGDGESPYGGLVRDASGNLYGTTSYDDYYGAGTVFEVTP